MEVWKWIVLAFFGLAAGTITAAGYFAVVTSVGIINRIADVTNTKTKIILYENLIILGASTGNLLFVLDIHIPLGVIGVGIYGLMAGMFLGLFAVCLAENTKALPIFARRIRVGAGLGLIIVCMGLGKAVGHLLYYFKLYG